jgi:hypothetical protein
VYHSHESLTSLSLFSCGPWAGDGHPVAFPNLVFLSLFDIPAFKPYITSPRLQMFHEAYDSVPDSFPRPLGSLTEYGVLSTTAARDSPRFHAERLHGEFPNLVRLSLRAAAEDTLAFFRELADFPACFPNLRCVEAENFSDLRNTFSHSEILDMEYRLACRNRTALSVPLKASFWEPEKTREIPLLFADVCDHQLCFLE